MGISHYLKVIGRGKQGARPLDRVQAADLFGQVLDGETSDLEVGAFCIAMRVKGESPEEMAGFLDATHQRLNRVPAAAGPVVVLPSYNGARRLPVLTPLLALLLARHGLPVLIHGTTTESSRVPISDVLGALGITPLAQVRAVRASEAAFVPTELLHAGLKRLLDVRRVIGLRNSAHSLVKLMNPCAGRAVVVGSYTHPEYAVSMAAVIELMGSTALLLRGTEGEVVADARRHPQMEGFVDGRRVVLEESRRGTLTDLPGWPDGVDPAATARYIGDVLAERQPLPASIALQVEHILRLARAGNRETHA
ncbi:MAG: Anthranilate phosphoribosyltransferase like [uncultured Ramlibacter sp.]|uniref:Anthranilate phosphoribosyltransferase like n=1 Tax=uncultured Ramlibacter sp. TaxID=260755 RepID=A0A6J4PXU3_9BURK|nr:MAG: Anthranilate phosphoribosyltransferase like [uncultured Ramlibacter sp.]